MTAVWCGTQTNSSVSRALFMKDDSVIIAEAGQHANGQILRAPTQTGPGTATSGQHNRELLEGNTIRKRHWLTALVHEVFVASSGEPLLRNHSRTRTRIRDDDQREMRLKKNVSKTGKVSGFHPTVSVSALLTSLPHSSRVASGLRRSTRRCES